MSAQRVRLTTGAQMFLLVIVGALSLTIWVLVGEITGSNYDSESWFDSDSSYVMEDNSEQVLQAISNAIQLNIQLCSIHVEYMNNPQQEDTLWSVFDIDMYTECTG